MKAFEWSTQFKTGLTEVDAQHRRLVEPLNALADQLDVWMTPGASIVGTPASMLLAKIRVER